jgi:hypothetical protein
VIDSTISDNDCSLQHSFDDVQGPAREQPVDACRCFFLYLFHPLSASALTILMFDVLPSTFLYIVKSIVHDVLHLGYHNVRSRLRAAGAAIHSVSVSL